MITVEVSVGGRAMTAEGERELADRLLLALTTEDSAPDVVLDAARELTHVLVRQPGTWATGGAPPDTAPRYLVRITVPAAWSNDPRFAAHVVPLVTGAVAATEPDRARLGREPHCVVQIVGLREHAMGMLGRPVTSTEVTRFMTRGFRESGATPDVPDGVTVDPVCGMRVEWSTAKFTLTHDGADYAFCAPSCRKVFAEDHAVAPVAE